MKSDIINNWRPEVRSLLARLLAAGCTLVECEHEDLVKFKGDLEAFITELTCCDECAMWVITPSGKKRWMYLVLGNEPGVIVSDYTVDPILDKVTDEHYKEWENRPQPKAERADIRAAEEGKGPKWTCKPNPFFPSGHNRRTLTTSSGEFSVSIETLPGAESVPALNLQAVLKKGEEAKRDALIMRLQETIDSFFGRVS